MKRKKKLLAIIKALKAETVPFHDHPDPGAISDCWDELERLVCYQVSPEQKRQAAKDWANSRSVGDLAQDKEAEYDFLNGMNTMERW